MRKPLWLATGTLVVVFVAAVGAWRLLHLSQLAQIGTGYAAQQTCACLFISLRSPESCHRDLDPLARWFVSVKPTTDEVTARVFGVARAVAHYQGGFGCSLKE
jgi:hypothetical protein